MIPDKSASSCKGKCLMGKSYCKIIASLLIIVIFSLALWFYINNNSHKHQNDIEKENFAKALDFFHNNKLDDALVAFNKVLSQDNKTYSSLSQMYVASILEATGDTKKAVEKFLQVANNKLSPSILRYTATLHAAWILVDTESYDDISKILKELIDPSNPMRQSANEILGISALKSGDIEKAKAIFEEIINDQNSPPGVATRTQMILANIIASDHGNKTIKK
ncbi:tetratricopeptide repeat protein [Candidatus Liberibacter brunswickensis]|uniref:tetratricopeptide repeat protein n=1 Tax=Candidatus Liberibacter brunswickensis TaxID=1968796 RepID=UPI002FE425C6